MNRFRTILSRARDGATAFVSAPASARPVACLRIGLSLVLLAQALAIAGNVLAFYGPHGIVQWLVIDWAIGPGVPKLSWVADALVPRGATVNGCVQGMFLVYVGSLAALLVGWRTRWAAAVAWVTHLALKTTGYASTYGVDLFADIGLFYCVWMPVGHSASLDLAAGRVSGAPSWAARLGLRVLQLHLCMVYLDSGIEKALGAQWWNGEAIWRAVTEPAYRTVELGWLASVPWVAQLLCWGTLLVEAGYAFFVWPRRTRKLWALNTMAMHLGIGLFMGLVSFAGVMIVLTGSAFLVSAEPRAQEAAPDTAAPASAAPAVAAA